MYLATPLGGHLFYADLPASVGATLTAVQASVPFITKGLWVAETPGGALRTPYADWPCALWQVEVAGPKRALGRGRRGLYKVDSLTVLAALDPTSALGPTGPLIVRFLQTVESLRADQLQLVASAEDEWLAERGEDADQDRSPIWRAFTRGRKLVGQLDRENIVELFSERTREAAEHTVGFLWNIDYAGSRRDNPYRDLKLKLANACFYATTALTVADQLDAKTFALLTEDFERLTNLSLAPGTALNQVPASACA